MDTLTVHPGAPLVSTSNLNEVSLKGTNEWTETVLGSWNSIADFIADELLIDAGSWELTLTAKKENATFSDTQKINVVK